MTAASCPVPEDSALDRTFVEEALFSDAWRVALAQNGSSVVDIFFAAFGHHPAWLKAFLILRHRVGAWFGLKAASAAQIAGPVKAASYRVGDDIGPWPIHFLSEAELIAGRDDKHLDFRVSVLKQGTGRTACAIISTVCRPHNRFGRVYLLFVAPFHRWGMRHLLSTAVRAGRL